MGKCKRLRKHQLYVHDLHFFVTVHLLEETLAVLSLGKLCEEHGYTYEWASGQKPHLTKDGKNILCKTENYVPSVVPGLSSSSSKSSSSTSPPQDSSTSLNPANSRSNEEAPGNWRVEAAGNSSEGLPKWLVDFTENLEIVDMPAAANISYDSDPERPVKVAPRKRSFCTHFLRDPNCEVCKRTKIIRAPCRRRTGEVVRLNNG